MKHLILLLSCFFIVFLGFGQTPLIAVSTDSTSTCKGNTTPIILTATTGSYSGNTQFLNASQNSPDQVACNCPAGYVAVGYYVRGGQWMDGIQLACKKLNPDGTLDPNVVYTSSGGGDGGTDLGSAVFNDNNTVLTGAHLTGGNYSMAASITGYGQPVSNIIGGADNSYNAIQLNTLGAGTLYDAGTAFAPPGYLITGMTVVNGYVYGGGPYVQGLSFRYSSVNDILKRYTINWSNGQTGYSISVLPTETTKYIAMVTASTGQSASDSQTIEIYSLPIPQITASGVYFCAGENITLSVPQGYASYQWNNGATTPVIHISQSNSYNVTVSTTNGCSANTSGNVKAIAAPNSADIYVDSSISSSGEGTSWTTAFKTLQEAISAANGCSIVKNIWVAKGTYQPATGYSRDSAFAVLRGGLKIYGGYPAGGGTRNITANPTILSGDIGTVNDNSDNSYHVLVIAGLKSSEDSLVLDGFTIRDGNANGTTAGNYGPAGAYHGNGGGAYIIDNANAGKISLRNLFVTNNSADYVAGGFEINNSSPSIINCTFSNNNSNYKGGGMFNEVSAAPAVTNCVFVSNNAINGAGMYNTSSLPVITNCTFYANNSNDGTGIYNDYSSAIITNCIIWANTGSNGGIYSNDETPVVTYSDVQDGYVGTGNVNIDPLLANGTDADGADNIFGTNDDGLRLTCSSPGVDKGDNNASGTTADITGAKRIEYSAVDMGAYELPIGSLIAPTVKLSANPGSKICSGTNVSFTATPVNGGADPVYQWKKNGAVVGTKDATYATTGLSDKDTITVQLTSNASCLYSATAADTLIVTVNAISLAPSVTSANNCGSSILSTTATGSLLWSTGATTAFITVTNAGDYTVTQTVNGCTSGAGTATAAPKTIPVAPVVTVTNNCGSSTLSTTATGSLLWSTGATTASITVISAGNYTVTQTVNGCTSGTGAGMAAPKTAPAAPVVIVTNNCGTSTLSTTATGSLLWSTAATTPSITVSNAGNYTVTQTVNGCTSEAGTATAAPKTIPAAPVVTVTNNCGSSTLSTIATGSLLWSTGATTPSIPVSSAGNYSVTQTINGCTSEVGAATATPKTVPATPVVTVTNNCGSSILSTTATGSLLWSTGAITPSITVTNAGNYTVTQTVNGCTSTQGSGTAAPGTPTATPVVTVINNCGNSILSVPAGGTMLWSNGATTPSVTVTTPGIYKVTRTLNGCTSAQGSATAAPKATPAPPSVTVVNACGGSILSAICSGVNLLWNTGATTPLIATTNAGTYTVTQTVNGCTSASGKGIAVPRALPAKPVVTVTNNCGSSVLTTTATGSLLWSTGAKTLSISANAAGVYSVIQTVNGCPSLPGSGTATPNKAVSLTANNILVNTAVNNCSASVAFGSNVTAAGAPAPTLVYRIGNTLITSPRAFSTGATTVNVTATNSCGSITKTFLVTVKDNQAPAITCKSGATKTVSGTAYTVSGAEFNATASDNCGTSLLIYSLGGATSASYKSTNTSLAGVKLNIGSTTITWRATDASGNTSTCATVVKVSKTSSYSKAAVAPGIEGDKLSVKIAPNPSSNYFTLQVRGGSTEICKMMVVDVTGRLIERRENVAANSTIQLGSAYRPGIYIAEILQGNERISLKLIKEGN